MNIKKETILLPEFLCGTAALGFVFWLFPSAYSIQYQVVRTLPPDPALQLAAASCIISLLGFLLLGVFCWARILECVGLGMHYHIKNYLVKRRRDYL